MNYSDEYVKFKTANPDDPTTPEAFVAQMESVHGKNGLWKRANDAIDSAFDYTPAPGVIASPADTGAALGGLVGGGFDSLVGTHIQPTLESVGRSTPRMVAEGLLTAPLGGGSTTARALGLAGKALGYGSAFTRGTAESDGNVLGGVVSAGSLGLGNVLIPKAGEAAERGVVGLLERGTPDFVPGQVLDAAPSAIQRGVGDVANVAGGVGAATGINEATRQAQLSMLPDEQRTPGDRNPFTQENVAGNVAGSAFFLPQLVTGLMHGGPKVSPKQVGQLSEHLATQAEAAKTALAPEVVPTQTQVELGLDQTPKVSPELSRHDALLNILEQSIENKRMYAEDARPEDVARLDKTIDETYQEIMHGRYGPPDAANAERAKAAITDLVKFQPPDTPEKFQDLATMIKSNLDRLNEGRVGYEEELAQRESTLNTNDKKAVAEFNKWKLEQATRAEDTPRQTWHPKARASQVLDRLWKSGDLPPLSEEWMRKEWGTTYDQSASSSLANQVLAQKMANYYADRLDTATASEAANRKAAVAPSEYTGTKIDERERKFIEALHALPKDVLRPILNRTVEIRGEERIDNRTGQPVTRMKEWQHAVVRAANSYDPETGTILVAKRGKPGEGPVYEKVPVTRLTEKASGGYAWNPSERRVSVSEGGKPAITNEAGQQVAEGNIEALQRPSGEQIDIADEEAFKRALAEKSDMPYGERTDLALDEANTLSDPVVDFTNEMPNETQVADKMAQKKDALSRNLGSLSDEQLWRLAEPLFKTRTSQQKAAKQAGLRLALTAALENMKTGKGNVSDAGKRFMKTMRDQGNLTTKGKGEAEDVKMLLRGFFQSKETLPALIAKLTDEGTVARVKSGGPQVKMQTDEERPLVRFSAPVRLQKWLDGQYKVGVTPNAIGQIPSRSVEGLLTKLGISKDEMAVYRAAGLDKVLSEPMVKVAGLRDWMQENSPKVEVKKLEPKATMPDQKRLGEIQHIFESKGYSLDDAYDGEVSLSKDGEPIEFADLPKDLQTLGQEYAKLFLDHDSASSDAATGRYGVEPKELKDMPGAVDILVRVPQKTKTAYDHESGGTPYQKELEPSLYRGPHFGESDVNVLASVRGYVETLPSGEKVFHVFEVQSDWGQRVGKLKADGGPTNNLDHPLLAVYEQLALKAAVEHARSLGIRKVAISDAETAMMTEGHDRAMRFERDPPEWDNLTPAERGVKYAERDANPPEPSQAPGMRAAYDQRLPQTMEKLTGGKGTIADFGLSKGNAIDSHDGSMYSSKQPSPIFKNSDGSPKNRITARLYDISSAPDQFSAFGYGKPQVDDAGTPIHDGPSGASDIGTLANKPTPGSFTEDIARSFRTRIDALLGRAGYSGTTRQFYTELAVALAKQGQLQNADFYRIGGKQYGMAGVGPDGRAAVGVNLDKEYAKGREAAATLQLVQTLTHEIGHLDGYIRDGLLTKPDAYSQERERIVKNFDKFGEALTEDERQAMLTVIQEYVPEQLRNPIKQADGRPYGTSNPDEFAQQMLGYAVSILAHDTPQGRAAAKEMLDYAPAEVRELYRDTFRSVKDVMESMRLAVEDVPSRVDGPAGEPNVLTAKTDPFILSRGFETMLDTARSMTPLRYADKAMADARTWTTNFDRAPNTGMTNSVWFTKDSLPTQMRAQESMPERPSDSAVESVKVAKDFLNGPRAYDKSQRPGLMGRFLSPFRQEMWGMERNGNKMARPIADTIFQLEAGSHRLLSGLLGDFMKRGTDGSVKFDAANPLIDRISRERTGPYRDAINRISAWQQKVHEVTGPDGKSARLDAQSLFVQNEKGELVANPQVKGAQEFWERTRNGLSKEDQQFVASQSFVLDRLGQRARETLTASIAESNVNRATSLIMATNKRMDFQQASAIAKAAHDAFLSGNVMSLQGTIPPKQFEMLQRLFMGPDGKSGLIANYMDVVQHFENRPGYRSESLPHEWIVRYRTKDDQVKFDSRPTESQAQYLARDLQSRGYTIDGEIVNKADARQFSATDDPDGVLAKVTERENFVWDKFVKEMSEKHGGELGAELAGYVPLEASIRDNASKGVGKFLKERKDFVDRDSFDYIDSSLAYAERLAYSVAVRSMKQRVDLLLNDPSVRLQTSFQNLVRGHIQEMLRPQSQTAKELKGIVSGLMIGGNLSSAVVNSVQSLQSLVPVLDMMNGTKGNFVTPWKQLGRAVADATDFTLDSKWKETAASTKGIDPKKWTEEQTVAELWRRHNEAGGITHTVIDDVVFGQDQRSLTNAKFGRGDYGPVSKASLVRSGMYIANQYGMLPFRWVERQNAKVAFLAGARQAYEQGLRGDAAYAKAAQVQGLATFGGGRANATGLQTALSKGFTPGGAGLALALQQYGFGMLAMHGQFVKDALGQSKGLSSSEVWHARRAYGSFLMTQTALAGVLGMPLVGAALTALEKVFGIPANQAVRQGLASLGEDDESGATIAEIGLNGLADYWTGLDVSSRLGTSSLLGTSSYRGFNLEDLAGPVGSILSNGVKSLGYFGQGEPMRAATALAPNAIKKALQMTDTKQKYGDYGFRDAAGNLLYTPTDTEKVGYALGFRPRELARRQQMQQALQTADKITNDARGRELDSAAEDTIRGDPTHAQRLATQAMDADPVHGYQETLRAIMDRAVAATQEKDLLASGSRYNAPERSRISRTFGNEINPRQSEVELQDLRLQLATALGDGRIAPNAASYKQAAVIDSLVSGGSMPRSEAVRIVQMLGL